MTLLRLFYEFFKIGLFAVGGGLATIPFLQHLSQSTGWFTQQLITDMIAISESTPGPIGINMATYVGYTVAGVPGGIVATMGEILPSIILCSVIAHYLEKFQNSALVKDAFYGLRPAVTGLIAAAGLDVVRANLVHIEAFLASQNIATLFAWKKIALFLVVFVLIRVFKKHPIVYIAGCAVAGIVFMF